MLAYILGGVSLVVLIAGIAVFIVARTNFRAQLDDALLDRANTLGSLVVEENGVLEFEYDQPLDEADVGVLVRITADDGTVIAQSPDWPSDHVACIPKPNDQPILKNIRLGSDGIARNAALAKFASSDTGASSDGLPGVSDRVIIVEVIGRTDGVKRAQSAVLIALIVGGLFAVTGSAVAVWLGIRRGLIPVRELGSAVDGIDTQELILPARCRQYPEELRPMVSALEGLLDRLRAAMDRERRFTDAAAHELRTPIAELKTITDVANRWPDPERLHRSVRDARDVVRQMEDLLENLLAAARDSAAHGRPPVETVMLLPLARALSEEAVERLQHPDVSWSFKGNDEVSWEGPRGVIVALVRNLIDNAAEYTPEGGSVCIRATGSGNTTAFEVENGPVSLEPSEVEHIFEPFWRADGSRSDRNHRGLGLAIVDSLAGAMELHRDVAITRDRQLRIRLASERDEPRLEARSNRPPDPPNL